MVLSLPSLDPARELVVAIMAGGAGTRFWPASTTKRPKQFLPLTGERTLLQMTFDRVASVVGAERVLVLTQQRFQDLVHEQLPDLPKRNIIGEPMRRDTAAAVALAATVADAHFRGPDGQAPVLAILASDHVISPDAAFQATLVSAARGAKGADGALYTFGLEPRSPSTAYGYLEVSDVLGDDDGVVHQRLVRQVEKPARAVAEGYVAGGKHLWNSGMFVWSTTAILGELERQLPAHRSLLQTAAKRFGEDDFDAALAAGFEPLEKISIDYGVMENAQDVRCVRATFDWSDVGGFVALKDHLPVDDDDNAHRAELVARDARGNIVFAEDATEQVALIGVEDLIVVRVGARTLVVHKHRAEEIKQLVDGLPVEDR